MGVADLRLKLADVPAIDTLTMSMQGGQIVLHWGEYSAQVGSFASDAQIEAAIRNAIKLPPVTLIATAAPATVGVKPMATGFAAGLKQMMDEARAGVEKARSDGLATVQEAVGKLDAAKTATTNVAGNIAKTIEDEAASVMAELGQISNDLGV